jgi:predicted Zn-dependent protease
MGDKMTYHVATDDKTTEKEGAMAATWMKAAGQGGIPTAFVIEKKGRIAWIGHPMELTEALIEDLLADRYDLAKATADYERNDRNQQILLGWSQKLDQQGRAKDWPAALATLDQMDKLVPEKDRPGVAMSRFQILLLQKDFPAAYKLASALSDANPADAQIQNILAWTIATMDGLEKRNLSLAEKFAGRAVDDTKGADSNVLDTLARVQFMNGKKSPAIATEKRAVAAAEERDKEMLRKTLASYEKGKLPEPRD